MLQEVSGFRYHGTPRSSALGGREGTVSPGSGSFGRGGFNFLVLRRPHPVESLDVRRGPVPVSAGGTKTAKRNAFRLFAWIR